MNVQGYSSCVPSIRLPTIEVADIAQESFWNNTAYIPVLSNVKGAVDILAGTARIVAHVALTIILTVILIPTFIAQVAFGPPFNARYPVISPTPLIAYITYLVAVEWNIDAAKQVGRGLVESTPIAGNLALGLWDGKIKIHP